VRCLGGDLLGLDHDALLDVLGLGAGVFPCGAHFLAAVIDLAGQRLQPGPQRVQVADRVRGPHGGQQAVNGRSRAARGQVGGRDALLEQGDFGLKGLELAAEEGQRLIRAARLP